MPEEICEYHHTPPGPDRPEACGVCSACQRIIAAHQRAISHEYDTSKYVEVDLAQPTDKEHKAALIRKALGGGDES